MSLLNDEVMTVVALRAEVQRLRDENWRIESDKLGCKQELAVFKGREQLVLEVIRLRQAIDAKLAADDSGLETIRLSDALWEAHGKLAEWKP
jgi:hypothetical protein